jgi:hypothetical protein
MIAEPKFSLRKFLLLRTIVFVDKARDCEGLRRIARIGSVTTSKRTSLAVLCPSGNRPRIDY